VPRRQKDYLLRSLVISVNPWREVPGDSHRYRKERVVESWVTGEEAKSICGSVSWSGELTEGANILECN
jgi:hypothetical protein